MSRLDELIEEAESLAPDDRLRLIAQLWASLPPEHWAAPSSRELTEVSRRMGDYDANRIQEAPWHVVRRMLFPEPREPAPKLYAATRRFDLATIFVAMALYSVMFAGMNLLGAPPLIPVYFGVMIALVGLGQALLEKFTDARRASIYVGACVHTFFVLALTPVWLPWISPPHLFFVVVIWLFIVIINVVIGGAIGYLVGALVGGIFLVADVLRGRFGKAEDDAEAQAKPAPHPLDGPAVPQL